MARRMFRIARMGSRARLRPDLRISEADPAPQGQRTLRSSERLLIQVKARQQRLYGARWASATLPPPREEAVQADAETSASSASHSRSSMSNPRLRTLAKPGFAVRALNNLSYGATPTSIAEFNALGGNDFQRLANWVDWQLDWTSIDDSALDARLASAGYTTLGKSLTQLWADHIKADPEYDVRMRPAWEVQRAAYVRATHSRRQLREVIANFWHAHFNVMGSDFSAGPVFVHYDRDVIRANATGNFRTMLEAVASSTSMLYYLDNLNNSRAGPNENFARELLELHTLGVDNYLGFMDPFLVPKCPEDPAYPIGYTDIDVYETSAAFTGWSAKNGHWEFPAENDGTFVYRQSWHDAGPKFLLGMMVYPEQPALKDGRDVLDRLASHPRVAKFICKKLIRRFINDTPKQALIDSAAAIFRANWKHPQQIEITLRHILNSDDLYNSWGQKIRRPFEATVAAMRVLGQDWTLRLDHGKSDEFMWRVGYTGHTAYNWPSPNGYPDTAVSWSGANSFAMTWKLLNWMTETKDAEVPMSPILDATRAGVASWTADNLVAFWCRRVLGYQPTAARKSVLARFMAQNGNAATDVIADTDEWSANDLKKHYNQQRLRSMVSLILLSPEFQTR
ncbi:hypothetical protein CSC74_04120 [Pseudoxanthomonas yeongjuensis]|uniref:DUF1800 domain-containing protein n=1 Tax=Pseudoxanthomonas yeongjuensis TaxID=377616 RepID=UPI0013913AA9|nr:DUF1800 domain-containing protein [Pseudoxanthomonas yeongjuensis]KAF1718089.1 hypothetical protein CSC74_04120 [Pseudoxanthomonas yeongjuensis]